MKLPVIRDLATKYDVATLEAAEAALMEGETLSIEVGGDDEGEQLTHLIGAIQVRKDIDSGADPKDALRNYTQRVRNSIS